MDEINTIYEIRDKRSARIVGQCTSLVHALREVEWHGGADAFQIGKIYRGGWRGRIGRSTRYVAPWPEPKTQEFVTRWLRGDKIRDLENYFDTSMTALDKKRREMGFPVRLPKGLWDADDETSINFMFDEGMTIDEIAQHFKRTKNSVAFRLRKSSEKSDRRTKYTKRAPPRYGKTRWPRKKEVQRKLDEARKLARGG